MYLGLILEKFWQFMMMGNEKVPWPGATKLGATRAASGAVVAALWRLRQCTC